MNSKRIIVIGILILAAIGLVQLYMRSLPLPDPGVEIFAQCLADKGATMYGAAWCPHCQNEKRAFGESFRLIPYVECPQDPQRCIQADIKGYPTWTFPDGRKFEGEQGLQRLSEISGCILNESL